MPKAIPVLRFGAFELNLQSRELRKQGMRIRIEAKPFQILELLLEHAGEVVTRQTLCEKLWPDTYVGYEHSLNTAVNKLRSILCDFAQSPRFVETLPRVGYRFIAPVYRPELARPRGTSKMLVVLPFESLSDEARTDSFADGLTEETTLQLSQLNPARLGVIARTCAVQYKWRKKSVREIAEELGVDYAIEGSVRREGRRTRITCQLIETRDQTHRWSASYDRDLRNALAVQTQVARQIRIALEAELLGIGGANRVATALKEEEARGQVKGTPVPRSSRPPRVQAPHLQAKSFQTAP